jgi:hypothetical protein
MEFTETPSVTHGFDRKITFPTITWLTKARFELLVSSQNGKGHLIQPCLNEDVPQIEKRIFIGKTIPQQPLPFASNSIVARIVSAPLTYRNLEQVGNVFRDRDGAWKLRITFRGSCHNVHDNFLVLSIQDPNSFYWSSNIDLENERESSSVFRFNRKEVASYALKVAVDQIDSKFIHIGRSSLEPRAKRPRYYSNGWYLMDDEDEPQVFGRIDRDYKLMFTPFRGLEVGHDHFETLCLRASPASLKTLCRSSIRATLNFSQRKIGQLREIVPSSLVEFLKYPAHLRVGEFMLSDEKLVDDAERFELAIEKDTGDLVCRSLDEETTTTRRVIAKNVDLIALQRFNAVFYNRTDGRAFTQHSVYENLLGYKFFIQWETSSTSVRAF